MIYTIPVYARFQWLNNPQVVYILSQFLKPNAKGRKGYDKVWMFQWLIYKQLMGCSYRDLESITGVDYSTFIKFRHRLISTGWFHKVFVMFSKTLARQLSAITLVADSSFVETYSQRKEPGASYWGYKQKTGFKLHAVIDYRTRLPLLQKTTKGSASDVIHGAHLMRAAPYRWRVRGFLADKAYDAEWLVMYLSQKWPGVKVGIPVRQTCHQKVCGRPESPVNRRAKERPRTLSRPFLNKRGEVERYFSRKKGVFGLGEERTRGIQNFRANCYATSIMEILEWYAKNPTLRSLFTKLEVNP